MKTYYAIITTTKAVEVKAESEEQAIEIVRSQLNPRELVDIQIAEEIKEN
jgi:hypothetical protein